MNNKTGAIIYIKKIEQTSNIIKVIRCINETYTT